MAVNPWTVQSPRRRLAQGSLRVIHHVPGWSLALGVWDGNRALLVRWNGDAAHPMGNPASHGYPTWFVLPGDLRAPTLDQIPNPNRAGAKDWLAGGEPSDWVNPISN